MAVQITTQSDCENEINYNYKNTKQWAQLYPSCGGKKQSPIDLDFQSADWQNNIGHLTIEGMDVLPSHLQITNTGHTVQIDAEYADENPVSYRDGPLKNDYRCARLQFRWGSTDDVGSEHTVNGKSSPMELQLTCYKREYGNIASAQDKSDGIMMVTQLAELTAEPDNITKGFDVLGKILSQIKEPGTSIPLEQHPLSLWSSTELLKNKTFPYAKYDGSKTSPPCTETVIWLIYKSSPMVNQATLAEFRKIKLDNDDTNNNRPVQERNGREIIFSYL